MTENEIDEQARRLHSLLRNGKDMWADQDEVGKRYYRLVARLFIEGLKEIQ